MIVYLVYAGNTLIAIFRNEKKADEYIAEYGDEYFSKESWVTEWTKLKLFFIILFGIFFNFSVFTSEKKKNVIPHILKERENVLLISLIKQYGLSLMTTIFDMALTQK